MCDSLLTSLSTVNVLFYHCAGNIVNTRFLCLMFMYLGPWAYCYRSLCVYMRVCATHLNDLELGYFICLSYDVTSGSEIIPCNKIDKLLVVYRFTGNVMTSIRMLHI